MDKDKVAAIRKLVEEMTRHISRLEEELFYLRSALKFAGANPPTYTRMIQEFQQCLTIVKTAPEYFFDAAAILQPYAGLPELLRQLPED